MSWSLSTLKFHRKKAIIVPLTANTNASKQIAYLLNVEGCTRLFALAERIGVRLYGHHSVAAFSSVAYKFFIKFLKIK